MVLTKKNINSITAMLLLVTNVVMLFVDRSNNLNRYINISIPLIALIFIYIFKNKNMSLAYMLFGIVITVFGSSDNYSGSIMFFLSMYDNKKKNNIIINIIIIATSLCLKSYLTPDNNAHIYSLITSFFFVIGHMYVRIWDVKTVNTEKCKRKGLTPENIATLEVLIKGLKHEESATILHIARKTYTARLSSLRTRMKVDTDFQLGVEVQKEGLLDK